jgi:hypothetical protein
VKHSILDDTSAFQVFDNYSLQQLRRDVSVPDPFRINHDYRAALAHAQARGFATFDAIGPEEQAFTLQQRRE